MKGYSAPEPNAVVARVRRLAEQLGDSPVVFLTLLGMWAASYSRRDWDAAHEIADRLLAMAGRIALPSAGVWAHFMQGAVRFHSGEPAPARQHFEQAVRLYEQEEQHLDLVQDPGVVALAYAGLAAGQLGLPQTARERIGGAVDLARRLGRRFDLALAEMLSGILDVELREPAREGALERLDALVRVCDEQQFRQILSNAMALRGWALVQRGRSEEGIAALRGALTAGQETGNLVSQELCLSMLAEALAESGSCEDALTVVDDALLVSSGGGIERADQLRLRADLLARRGAAAAPVETAYREAISVARRQGTRTYELRATTHLGRWLRGEGRGAEARALLQPLYDGSSKEGESYDLREARALLESLAR